MHKKYAKNFKYIKFVLIASFVLVFAVVATMMGVISASSAGKGWNQALAYSSDTDLPSVEAKNFSQALTHGSDVDLSFVEAQKSNQALVGNQNFEQPSANIQETLQLESDSADFGQPAADMQDSGQLADTLYSGQSANTRNSEQSAGTQNSVQPAADTQDLNKKSTIALVGTNDVHCNAVYQDKAAKNAAQMGYAYLAGYVEQTKNTTDSYGQKLYDDVDLVSAGDDISGGPGYGFLSKGEKIAQLMGDVGYSFTVPGNHEFDYGIAQYDHIVDMLKANNCETISCNFAKKDSDGSLNLYLNPYGIKTYKNGKKVAFIGISTPESLAKCNPKNFMDDKGNIIYSFYEDKSGQALCDQIQKTVDFVQQTEKPDCIVALSHLGDADYITPQWKTQNVIAKTKGIDMYFDGHSHSMYSTKYPDAEGREIPIIQSGSKMQALGFVKIDFNDDGTKNIDAKTYWTSSITEIGGITDTESFKRIDAKLAELKEWYDKLTGKKIGTSEVDLDYSQKYYQEVPIGNFVSDAYRATLDADVAVENNGGIRAGLSAGDLTVANMIDVNSFGNEVVKLQTKGIRILDMLEYGAVNASSDPKINNLKYQVSGLTFDIRLDIPSSVVMDGENFVGINGPRRVQNVKINGEPLDINKNYTIAGTVFLLTDGGGGLTTFNHEDTKTIPSKKVIAEHECLVQYLTTKLDGKITAAQYGASEGRINAIDAPKGTNTIFYYSNGEDRGSVPASVTFKDQTNLAKKDVLGKEGYSCVGWNTSRDAAAPDAKHYDFDAVYNEQADLVLYPEWSTQQTSLTGAQISKIENQKVHEDGSPVEPEVEVFVSDSAENGMVKLQKGIDYTVSYENNIKPGKAKVIVTGTNYEYKDATQAEFTITGKQPVDPSWDPSSGDSSSGDASFDGSVEGSMLASQGAQTGDSAGVIAMFCLVLMISSSAFIRVSRRN